MNTGDVIGIAGLAVSILGFVGILLRLSHVSGKLTQRVDTIEIWKREKSTDRTELDEVRARVKIVEDKVEKFEAMDRALAILTESFRGFRELYNRDAEQSKHDNRDLRMAVDSVRRRMDLRPPSTPTP